MMLGLDAIPADLPELLAQGDDALAAGRLVEAIELYQLAAAYPEGRRAVAPKIAQARLALARQEQTDPSSAFQAARDAWLDILDEPGLNIPARRGLAETYLALGETMAAAEQWAIVFAANPADLSLWYQLAPAHLDKGEWEAAGQAYAAIAAAESGNAEANFWAGALLAADPSLAQLYLLEAAGDPFYAERAEKLLLALADLTSIRDPAHAAARLGFAYLDCGEFALAQRQFEAALADAPAYADAWAYLGLAQDQLGGDGRQAIAQAIELEPDKVLGHSLMGHHWLWFDQPHLARQEFIDAWQLNPENPVHLADVALTYQAEGDYRSAEAWYQAAIRSAPDDATFWVLLARFYLDALYDVANSGLLAAQRAVALSPEDSAALDTLGWAQFLDGQSRLAETNLLAARQRDPSNPAIHYHLGRLYDEQGEWAKAEDAFKQAIDLGTCRGCSAARPGSFADLAERALKETGR